MLLLLSELSIRGYKNTSYEVDSDHISMINSFQKSRILIFHGPWCSDCQKRLPELISFVDSMTDQHHVQSVRLDHSKKDKNGLSDKYKISKIPTVLVIGNGKRCRITEQYNLSWEADINKCLKSVWTDEL
ncbi:Thioredoxin domain-containing protein [Spironucleus salmonicida]|uniref:Thioredoxin domain-containing protein n=1 Tax=Spironucleus salmonicida TaxID=348837 RepID=V6LYZ0_9EUKA|nr:Thioredoxin domain-containing protein [Spironucleus salmonicida]|eukprot:EST48951.1 Thioredoxin domain-containing protein [Spironucleus salmonicida]